MCAKAVVELGLGLALSLSQSQTVVTEPPMDQYGRVPTTNQYGYCDTNLNSFQLDFIEFGNTHCGRTPSGRHDEQFYLMEIGGAYGYVALPAIQNGAFYLFNDLAEDQVLLASQKADPDDLYAHSAEFGSGPFPDASCFRTWKNGQYRIAAIGAFSVIHFLSTEELKEFMAAAWDMLEPGGRLYLVAATRFNRMFNQRKVRGQKRLPQLMEEYHAKRVEWRQRGRTGALPGDIPDMTRYNPGHLEHHPPRFHVYDLETLRHVAHWDPLRPWNVQSSAYIQRPNPNYQAMPLLYKRGWGELVGVILEKPGILAGTHPVVEE